MVNSSASLWDVSDQQSFVLELLSPKKRSDVSLVMNKLLEEVSGNGYEFVDSENGFLFNSSRKAWMNWLVNAITFWSCKLEENDQEIQTAENKALSELLDQLSELVALFSGRAAASERIVTFEMHNLRLKIREPSYGDSDLGWQTWPAGILLASYISKMDGVSGRDTLELGCGTGLVGIASALLNPQSSHFLTDYHENVLLNVNKNVGLNGPPSNITSQKLNWDWFEGNSISWTSDPHLRVLEATCENI
ncbi:Protein-lysine N-methyltransferase rrg1 [Entomophthora muscae]|uniref:Protein-lysine N-methyltransferase rrg1 n=1 Tax=Entomophthora muscae TaxID=34485 RepID=A0ACC2SAZ6_9FUNG|nr:Protein-lysine N-methyltransferase rrg1 [Entomophthora muscae]